MEFPRPAPSAIPQTSLGFQGHLITNFPRIMVLLIINRGNTTVNMYCLIHEKAFVTVEVGIIKIVQFPPSLA